MGSINSVPAFSASPQHSSNKFDSAFGSLKIHRISNNFSNMGDIILFNAFGFVSAPRVSLRLPWAMNRLAFQAASGGRGAKEEDKVIIT